jgi:hypothetical protein
MADKEIFLLKQQILQLEEKNFDLDAWKNRTLIFLERIFGKDSTKLKMIKDLHYDYSSWNLRDTAASGTGRDKDPVKIQAGEILGAIITELEKLGVPKEKKEKLKIQELLEDELTGKKIKELETLINSEDPDKAEKTAKILEGIGIESLALTIAKLLTS